MGGGCHPENFYKFVVHKTESRKYPFSGIGLVRENPNDTIEIFYSNATEQEGVNEVLTAKFATDTVVGMNESWVNIDFGEKFGEFVFRFSSPDYQEKGGQYFKICNYGKEPIFYFIIPNPKRYEYTYEYGYSGTKEYEFYIIDKESNESIYDILSFTDYDKNKVTYVSDRYKKHDELGNLLYYTYKSKIKNQETIEYDFLSRTTVRYDIESTTTKINGKAFFYGTIYPEECLENSKYTGIMLQESDF